MTPSIIHLQLRSTGNSPGCRIHGKSPNLRCPPSRSPRVGGWKNQRFCGAFFFFNFSFIFFSVGNRGCGGPPPSPPSPPTSSRLEKSSFIPLGASPSSVCIGCGHPAWDADGFGVPVGCVSRVRRDSSEYSLTSLRPIKNLPPHPGGCRCLVRLLLGIPAKKYSLDSSRSG